ncbi:hypothetical protein BVIET440_40317 [Burkholderia vietnamiensis]
MATWRHRQMSDVREAVGAVKVFIRGARVFHKPARMRKVPENRPDSSNAMGAQAAICAHKHTTTYLTDAHGSHVSARTHPNLCSENRG